MHRLSWNLVWLSSVPIAIAVPRSLAAFVIANRWEQTASGFTGMRGEPITLTWSLVPDSTEIPNFQGSQLIDFFDANFGAGQGGSDLTARPWFHFFAESFDRWSQLGGMNFVFESQDDGALHRDSAGELGVRGDVRIAATTVNGPGSSLAFSQFPDTGDIVLDTGDVARLTNPSDDYRRLRNVLMHEIGHVLGLNHVVSDDAEMLMEPTLATTFLGPQHDDIRGLHYYYGDALERSATVDSGTAIGNDSVQNAIDLGELTRGSTLSVGTHAGPDTSVSWNEADFVSIHSREDIDVFAVTVAAPGTLSATVAPRGGVYKQAEVGETQLTYNLNASNNLRLSLSDGETELASANAQPAGVAEAINNVFLSEAGTYYLQVDGSRDAIQLYELSVALSADLPGDFSSDGIVDARDYTIWRDSVGQLGMGLAADANYDHRVDATDFAIWEGFFAAGALQGRGTCVCVPEPTNCIAWALFYTLGIISAALLRANHDSSAGRCDFHSSERQRLTSNGFRSVTFFFEELQS